MGYFRKKVILLYLIQQVLLKLMPEVNDICYVQLLIS